MRESRLFLFVVNEMKTMRRCMSSHSIVNQFFADNLSFDRIWARTRTGTGTGTGPTVHSPGNYPHVTCL